MSAEDRASADRARIRALAERFASGWSQAGPLVERVPVPDGRRAAAADPAETLVPASPETVKRLVQATQEIIDWIATGIWMLRIPGAYDRHRFWPDSAHESHLAKRSGLTRNEWERLVRLLAAEPSLPIVGRFVPGSLGVVAHWSPEEVSLTAWSKGWDWSRVIERAQGGLASPFHVPTSCRAFSFPAAC